MPVASRRSIIAFWLVVALARQTSAQELCLLEAPSIDVSPEQPAASELDDALEISARRIGVGADSAAEFSDEVQLRYRNCDVTAQSAKLAADGNVDVLGRIDIACPDVTVYGQDAHFDTDSETITFAGVGFDLPKRPARGSAEQVELTSESRLSLANALFTTCPPENVAWELSARQIELDANTGVGKARGVKLDFKGVPILYSPYFSFPIGDQRKSGFLTPEPSSSDRTGFDLTLPYYLNLAPNYDLLLEPRYMRERGTQLGGDFRYLRPNSRGELGFEYLPDDHETQTTRRYVNLQHESLFGSRDQWQVLTGIEEVSDETYFEDLGSSLSVTSQTHLNRFLDLNFFAPNWSLLTRFQNYQTIDPVLTDVERPYERVPQIVFGGRWGGQLVALD